MIHYSGSPENIKNTVIEKTSFDEFRKMTIAGNSGFCVVTIKAEKDSVSSPEEIVARAKSRLGEKQYNLITNNCESFCNWCINGVEISNQVVDAKEATLALKQTSFGIFFLIFLFLYYTYTYATLSIM